MTTTDLGYDDPPHPADLEARYRGALAELARIHEGGDSTPVPANASRTTAQAWWWLINADPADRMARLALLLGQADRGYECIVRSHGDRIEFLQESLNVLSAEAPAGRPE